jgi:hypothetical protein
VPPSNRHNHFPKSLHHASFFVTHSNSLRPTRFPISSHRSEFFCRKVSFFPLHPLPISYGHTR